MSTPAPCGRLCHLPTGVGTAFQKPHERSAYRARAAQPAEAQLGGVVLRAERWLVWLPDGAHARVAGSIPVRSPREVCGKAARGCCALGNVSLFSFPLSLSKNQ